MTRNQNLLANLWYSTGCHLSLSSGIY